MVNEGGWAVIAQLGVGAGTASGRLGLEPISIYAPPVDGVRLVRTLSSSTYGEQGA